MGEVQMKKDSCKDSCRESPIGHTSFQLQCPWERYFKAVGTVDGQENGIESIITEL